LLAIIWKGRFLNFRRSRGIDDVAEFEAQVFEITAGSRIFQEFFNDGLEVGQRTDSRQRWHVNGACGAAEMSQQESSFDHGKGNAAVEPTPSLALVRNAGA